MPPKKAAKKGKQGEAVKKEETAAEPPPPPKPPTPAPIPDPSLATVHIESNEQPLPVLIRSQGGSVAGDDYYVERAGVTPGHAQHAQEQFDDYDEAPTNHENGQWGFDPDGKNDDLGDTGHSAGGWGDGGGWGTPSGGDGTARNSGLDQDGWGRQRVAEPVQDDWESPSQPSNQPQAQHHPPSPTNVAAAPPSQPAPATQPPPPPPPQPSAGQVSHPVWGPYPPPSEHPRKYVSASDMAKKHDVQIPASRIPPAPQAQPPQQQQQPLFFPPHPGRPMPAGSRASHSASASIYNNWGQPKNVDLWGDPKPQPAPPPSAKGPPPQPVRQAWQDWGRPPTSRSVSGQSAPPHTRPHPAAHGWGYEDEDYTDDETDESDEGAQGWRQPAPSAWRTQGQGRHQREAHAKPPKSQISAHTPRPQPHPHAQFHGHGHPQQAMHGHLQHAHRGNTWHQYPQPPPPQKQGKPKKAHGDWGDGGWNDEASGWGGTGGQDDGRGGWGGHGGSEWEESGGDGGWAGHGGGGWGDTAGGDGGWGKKSKKEHPAGGWDDQGGWDAKSHKKGHQKDAGGQGDDNGWGDSGRKTKGKKDKKGGGGWDAAEDAWGTGGGNDDGWGKPADAWGDGDDGWDNPKPKSKGGKGTSSEWGDDWGQDQDDKDEWEEDDYDDSWEEARRNEGPKNKPRNISWGSQAETSYSMPSKTMTHAYNGVYAQPIDAPQIQKMNEYTNIHFVESHTQAFEKVHPAFFGRSRKAKERIHWIFSSQKDPRVAAHIDWLTKVEYNLGSYGLHKFLQTRERGALFTNVLHRAEGHPMEPTFDWLTFKQVQTTLDPILQDSVISYEPAMFVYVFVFLPSESGNSVAMWRRKVLVPNNTRLRFQQEIAIAMSGLKKEKDYKMVLDDPIPQSAPKSPPKAQSKAKAKGQTKAQAKDKVKTTPKEGLTRSKSVLKHQRSKSLPNAADGKETKKKRKWWQVLRFAD